MNQTKFGKFTIVSQLGAGGMAEVFKCRLSGIGGFDKIVVVKRILPSLATDEEFVRMFLDEARCAANLTHPNIVQVFEIDEIDGQPYMAMEYVDGVTLSQLHRRARREGKMSLAHMANIMAGVCEGLQYAHTAVGHDGEPLALVHRDVSPQNIMVSRDGVPKLLDFGVAKANGRMAHTKAGTLKGKLKYMAPEQVRGSESALDQRADVFSAGVCVYETTTGNYPYGKKDDSEITLLRNVIQGDLRKPSDFVPEYPPMLEEAVLWAVQPDPDKRCPTARDLQDALRKFVSTEPFISSNRAVAAWMTTLGPFEEEKSRNGSPPALPRLANAGGTPTRAGSGARSLARKISDEHDEAVDVELDSVAGAPARPRWMVPAIAGLGAVLLVGLTLLLLRPTPAVAPSLDAPLAEHTPAALPSTTRDPNKVALAFLDEAERYASQKRFRPAAEMLAKAREAGATDAAISIRLTRLSDEFERKALLLKAQTALRNDQHAEAIESAKRVLDNDPENAEALAVIAQARHARTASATPAPAPSKPQASRRPPERAPRDGRLSVQSTPSGAVYIDDLPAGRTPIRGKQLAAGLHTVQVRAQGYLPAETDVTVIAGRDVSVSLPLTPNVARSTSVAAVSEPSPEPSSASPPPAPVVSPPPVIPSATVSSSSASSSSEPGTKGVASISPRPPPAPEPIPSATSNSGGVAVKEKRRVQVPSLPKTYTTADKADLARVLALVEREAVEKGSVPHDFADRITLRLIDRLHQKTGDVELYPSAAYYFIVRESALGHDHASAADNLRNAYQDGDIVKFRDLPQKTINLR